MVQDRSCYLDIDDLSTLKEDGIQYMTILQCVGDVVILPGNNIHQVTYSKILSWCEATI